MGPRSMLEDVVFSVRRQVVLSREILTGKGLMREVEGGALP